MTVEIGPPRGRNRRATKCQELGRSIPIMTLPPRHCTANELNGRSHQHSGHKRGLHPFSKCRSANRQRQCSGALESGVGAARSASAYPEYGVGDTLIVCPCHHCSSHARPGERVWEFRPPNDQCRRTHRMGLFVFRPRKGSRASTERHRHPRQAASERP